MGRSNVILGAIRGYELDQLLPFVNSLKNAGYQGDVCFLYDHLSEATIRGLRERGVVLQPLEYRGSGALNSWSRFWKYVKPAARLLGRSAAGRKIMKMITPLQTSRFYGYYDYLVKNRDRYESALLTDVRDVIFQRDPFEGYQRTRVCCYEEDRTMREDDMYNVPWVKQLFGEHAADTFLDEKILCSGTILGPIDEMIRYIGEMEAMLLKAIDIGKGGSDQGLHNYLVRTKMLSHVEIVTNGGGEVLTVFEPNIPSYRSKNGVFVDESGNAIPILHQYERNKALEESLLTRLAF